MGDTTIECIYRVDDDESLRVLEIPGEDWMHNWPITYRMDDDESVRVESMDDTMDELPGEWRWTCSCSWDP